MFDTYDLFNDAFWAKESIFLFICSYFIFVLLLTGSCDCIHLPQFFFCGARSVFQGRRGVRVGSSRIESWTLGTTYELFECAFSIRHTTFDYWEEANFPPFLMKAEFCNVNCFVAQTLFCSFTFCVTDAFYRTGFYTRATRKRVTMYFSSGFKCVLIMYARLPPC